MGAPRAYSVNVVGHPCRVLEAGQGRPVVWLAGIGGLPRWSPFLEALSTTRRAIAPSLPGFPGATEFRHLDDYHDWVVAALELLEGVSDDPVDLVASSVTGPLLPKWRASPDRDSSSRARRAVRHLRCGGAFRRHLGAATRPRQPAGFVVQRSGAMDEPMGNAADEDPLEWGLYLTRAMEAAARYLFPMGNTGIERRLYRVRQPTLLLRGADDRVLPQSYLRALRRRDCGTGDGAHDRRRRARGGSGSTP